jgi:hypothetical protein
MNFTEEHHGVRRVLDRHGAHRSVERLVRERQSRLEVQVVDDVAREPWVVDHLLGVEAEPDDFARGKTWTTLRG